MREIFFMRKVAHYRSLLGVDKDAKLAQLKSIYRSSMKEWHPDRFHGNPQGQAEAEEKSREVIEAYHFLVSINPETLALELPGYRATIANATLLDYQYDAARLKVFFSDSSVYEFLSVPKATYVKMINADSPGRFAKRHIYGNFPYRKISNAE